MTRLKCKFCSYTSDKSGSYETHSNNVHSTIPRFVYEVGKGEAYIGRITRNNHTSDIVCPICKVYATDDLRRLKTHIEKATNHCGSAPVKATFRLSGPQNSLLVDEDTPSPVHLSTPSIIVSSTSAPQADLSPRLPVANTSQSMIRDMYVEDKHLPRIRNRSLFTSTPSPSPQGKSIPATLQLSPTPEVEVIRNRSLFTSTPSPPPQGKSMPATLRLSPTPEVEVIRNRSLFTSTPSPPPQGKSMPATLRLSPTPEVEAHSMTTVDPQPQLVSSIDPHDFNTSTSAQSTIPGLKLRNGSSSPRASQRYHPYLIQNPADKALPITEAGKKKRNWICPGTLKPCKKRTNWKTLETHSHRYHCQKVTYSLVPKDAKKSCVDKIYCHRADFQGQILCSICMTYQNPSCRALGKHILVCYAENRAVGPARIGKMLLLHTCILFSDSAPFERTTSGGNTYSSLSGARLTTAAVSSQNNHKRQRSKVQQHSRNDSGPNSPKRMRIIHVSSAQPSSPQPSFPWDSNSCWLDSSMQIIYTAASRNFSDYADSCQDVPESMGLKQLYLILNKRRISEEKGPRYSLSEARQEERNSFRKTLQRLGAITSINQPESLLGWLEHLMQRDKPEFALASYRGHSYHEILKIEVHTCTGNSSTNGAHVEVPRYPMRRAAPVLASREHKLFNGRLTNWFSTFMSVHQGSKHIFSCWRSRDGTPLCSGQRTDFCNVVVSIPILLTVELEIINGPSISPWIFPEVLQDGNIIYDLVGVVFYRRADSHFYIQYTPQPQADIIEYDGMVHKGFPQTKLGAKFSAENSDHTLPDVPKGCTIISIFYHLRGGLQMQQNFFALRATQCESLYHLSFSDLTLKTLPTIMYNRPMFTPTPGPECFWANDRRNTGRVEYVSTTRNRDEILDKDKDIESEDFSIPVLSNDQPTSPHIIDNFQAVAVANNFRPTTRRSPREHSKVAETQADTARKSSKFKDRPSKDLPKSMNYVETPSKPVSTLDSLPPQLGIIYRNVHELKSHGIFLCQSCRHAVNPARVIKHYKDHTSNPFKLSKVLKESITAAIDKLLKENQLVTYLNRMEQNYPQQHPHIPGLEIYDGFSCLSCDYCSKTKATMENHISTFTHLQTSVQLPSEWRKPGFRKAPVQSLFKHGPYFQVRHSLSEYRPDGDNKDKYALYIAQYDQAIQEVSTTGVPPLSILEVPAILRITGWNEHLRLYISDKSGVNMIKSMMTPPKRQKGSKHDWLGSNLFELTNMYSKVIAKIAGDSEYRVRKCLKPEKPWHPHTKKATIQAYNRLLYVFSYAVLKSISGHPSNYIFPLTECAKKDASDLKELLVVTRGDNIRGIEDKPGGRRGYNFVVDSDDEGDTGDSDDGDDLNDSELEDEVELAIPEDLKYQDSGPEGKDNDQTAGSENPDILSPNDLAYLGLKVEELRRVNAFHKFVKHFLYLQPASEPQSSSKSSNSNVNKWSVMIECLIALYSLKEDGHFRPPTEATQTFAKLHYHIRGAMLFEAWGRAISSGSLLYSEVKAEVRLNCSSSSSTRSPFDICRDYQGIISTLALASTATPNIRVSDDGKHFTCNDSTLDLDKWRQGLRRLIAEVEQELEKLCYEKHFGMTIPKDAPDDWNNRDRDYSWLTDHDFTKAQNPLLEAVIQSEKSVSQIIDGILVLNPTAMYAFLEQCAMINKKLALLCFFIPGPCKRVSDYVEHKFANSDSPRNLLRSGNDLWLVTRRTKAEGFKQSKETFIPSKCPPFLSRMLEIYLVIVRPLEKHFSLHLAEKSDKPRVSCILSQYLWVQNGKIMTDVKMCKEIALFLRNYCGSQRMNVKKYRQICVGMTKEYFGSMMDINLTTSLVVDSAMAHSSQTARERYAVEHGCLPGMTSQLLSDYGKVSEQWCKLATAPDSEPVRRMSDQLPDTLAEIQKGIKEIKDLYFQG